MGLAVVGFYVSFLGSTFPVSSPFVEVGGTRQWVYLCVPLALRKRKDIIIKEADKGSTVVIQDRQGYVETGLEHFSDRDTYNELQEDQTKLVAKEVTQAVRSMFPIRWCWLRLFLVLCGFNLVASIF